MVEEALKAVDGRSYAEALAKSQRAWWKGLLRVQRPYEQLLRRLCIGQVLDVGCGVGRCLRFFGSDAVGMDSNPFCLRLCREAGFEALTPDELHRSHRVFDTLLSAHVLEHLELDEARELLRKAVARIRPGGRVVLVVPQEAGFARDSTHVLPWGPQDLHDVLGELGVAHRRVWSFPFPPRVGGFFPFNEWVAFGRLPRSAS